MAFPKGPKLIKYVVMALLFCQLAGCAQRQVQVVCGGLVYFSAFRRQLLGSLNHCWVFIEEFNKAGRYHLPVPTWVRLEILRFVALVPLCRMDLRLPMKGRVTCSDASTSGGGICASVGLTPCGHLVEQGLLRPVGWNPDRRPRLLSIGLFDGIGCLRVALDLIGAQVMGHISVEKESGAQRVVEYHFPSVVTLADVALVTDDMVRGWSLSHSQVELILLGAAPPCQGVSQLNASRRGALLDERSSLFVHVSRIRRLLQRHFKWCPVHTIMESVASMDEVDKKHMSDDFGVEPWLVDSETMTWCRRPRYYWLTWTPVQGPGVEFEQDRIILTAEVDVNEFLSRGWSKVDESRAFPTFTTARPRVQPGHRPAGLHHCDQDTLVRWQEDDHRYPPYQYLPKNCVQNKHGKHRLPNIDEKELLMGLPLGYTVPCVAKSQRKSQAHLDLRHSLVGNGWSVPVVSWLLSQLLSPLGFTDFITPQDIMDRLDPSKCLDVRQRECP